MMAGDPGFRIEHDSMGEVRVPADALWGAQTQRAAANLPVSGLRIDRDLIAALGQIKAAAATINAEFGLLDADMAAAIAGAPPRWRRARTTRTFLWTCSRRVLAPRAT